MKPQPNMVPWRRFSQTSTGVFGTPCTSSRVLNGAQSMKQVCVDARRPSRPRRNAITKLRSSLSVMGLESRLPMASPEPVGARAPARYLPAPDSCVSFRRLQGDGCFANTHPP